jgi:hypothetical protein
MEEFANSGALSFSGLFIFVRKKLLSKFHETLPIFLNKADLHGGAELSSLEAEVPWEYHPLLYPLGLAGRLLVRSVYPSLREEIISTCHRPARFSGLFQKTSCCLKRNHIVMKAENNLQRAFYNCHFGFFTKICGDIHNFVFINTGDQAVFRIFIDSMTPAIILSPVTTIPAITNGR